MTEPELCLSPIGWNIQEGLVKYAHLIHANKWMIPHINVLEKVNTNDPDSFVRFTQQLKVSQLMIEGREVFSKIENWSDVPITLRNWMNECISALKNYQELHQWFWWYIDKGIDNEMEQNKSYIQERLPQFKEF